MQKNKFTIRQLFIKPFALKSSIVKLTILLSAIVAVATSCSTKKNTLVSRNYHDLTAYYNYYFNGNQSFENGVIKSEKNFPLNYTDLLPVFTFNNQQMAGAIAGDMDRAIKKATGLVARHSITVKPKPQKGAMNKKERAFYNQNEFCSWVPDAYLLMGKANVYSMDYNKALQTFNYMLTEYPYSESLYEAKVWMARIDAQTGSYEEGIEMLRSLDANKKFPAKLRPDLYLSYADINIKRKAYTDAIPYLEKALQSHWKKNRRVRLTYLLGQLYEKVGNTDKSIESYRKVIKMNPQYETSFNAQIKIATLYQAGQHGKDLRKVLLKLAKDEKNRDYLDLVYYALGKINLAEKDKPEAMKNFALSVSKSVSNNFQKGLSSITLADLYFEKPDYIKAQAYYDTAVTALDNTYPDYEQLKLKTDNLTNLVKNLNVIAREDSLQRIAKMSVADRNSMIEALIKKTQEEETAKREEEENQRYSASLYQQQQATQNLASQQQGTNWYFYNTATLGIGASEFQMLWGKRKLEDNWRRKNKGMSSLNSATGIEKETDEEDATKASDNAKKQLSKNSKEYYMADLPMTDSLMNASTKRIETALLKSGAVYQNQMKDYQSAIKTYEEFVMRFPASQELVSVYFNLYQLSLSINDEVKSKKYRDLIVNRFPNSPFAMAITSPDYVKKLQEKQNEEENGYKQLYTSYKEGKFAEAMQQATTAIAKYPDSGLQAKYHLILAICQGSDKNLAAYRNALAEVTKKFPTTEEAAKAKEMIANLNNIELKLAQNTGITENNKPEVTPEKPSVNYIDSDTEQYFVAVVSNKLDLNRIKFNIVSFNLDSYLNLNLNVSSTQLNQSFNVILVETLKDKATSMDYFKNIGEAPATFLNAPPEECVFFVISKQNYAQFIADKGIQNYMAFFRQHYKP
jgi:Tetratricopeptide repeat.